MIRPKTHIDFFSRYELPLIHVCAEFEAPDFITPARRNDLPPFAIFLHAAAQASLDVAVFRLRLFEDAAREITRLRVSYPVLGPDNHLNFSTLSHTPDIRTFVRNYLDDRRQAQTANALRSEDLSAKDVLLATCLPWLKLTAIEHPLLRLSDLSIPNVTVGRFEPEGERVRMPLAIQAHHGLVDALHIAQFHEALAERLNSFVREARHD